MSAKRKCRQRLGDQNQTKYQPRFRERLTLSRQSVGRGMLAVQLELSRRLRSLLASNHDTAAINSFGAVLLTCAKELRLVAARENATRS